MDAETALHIDALGEASLEHVVGGPENLWARSFFSRAEMSLDDDNTVFPTAKDDAVPPAAAAAAAVGAQGDEEKVVLSVPLMLLAARLQGAVATGRGPAVARALTATVPPFGGEWMLPRARPVQVTGSGVDGLCVFVPSRSVCVSPSACFGGARFSM